MGSGELVVDIRCGCFVVDMFRTRAPYRGKRLNKKHILGKIVSWTPLIFSTIGKPILRTFKMLTFLTNFRPWPICCQKNPLPIIHYPLSTTCYVKSMPFMWSLAIYVKTHGPWAWAHGPGPMAAPGKCGYQGWGAPPSIRNYRGWWRGVGWLINN